MKKISIYLLPAFLFSVPLFLQQELSAAGATVGFPEIAIVLV
jgi:hypothetical protein